MHSCKHASGAFKVIRSQRWSSANLSLQRRLTHSNSESFDRLSRIFIPPAKGVTIPEGTTEHDAHILLLKAGFLRQAQAGIFHLLPLGHRVQTKLEALIDKHMRTLGANRLSLSSITGEHLWRISGRLEGKTELFRVEGTHAKTNMLLAPTHEEEITNIVKHAVHSYRQLPLRLYQIGRKYRDERRPRAGLLRSREFVMKDLYTFDADEEAALETYTAVKAAYVNFFDELKVPYTVAEADSGAMGGNLSHEFHFASRDGEDRLIACKQCAYIANEELAQRAPPTAYTQTPAEVTTADICATAFVSRDRSTLVEVWHPRVLNLPQQPAPQVNTSALSRIVPDLDTSVTNAFDTWKAAQQKYRQKHNQLPLGKFTLLRLFDRSLLTPTGTLTPSATAALPDAGTLHLLESRTRISDVLADPATSLPLDLLRIVPGDTCPRCLTGALDISPATEVAHTFHLGTRYTLPFQVQFQVPTANNARQTPHMGCHGIGVSRLLAATATSLRDSRGLNWPARIAPYAAAVLPWLPLSDAARAAPAIAQKLADAGVDTVLDDRSAEGPSKAADADLVGYPVLVVLGRAWAEGRCEVQCRRLGVREEVEVGEVVGFVEGLLARL